jgi:predicted ester cyclase
MIRADLSDVYRGYIACLNKQDWPNLGRFVHEDVQYSGKRIGLSGYQAIARCSKKIFARFLTYISTSNC